MDEQVRQWAADSALDIVSVADEGPCPLETAERLCQVYAVRVAAEGNLNALAGFMARLEEANPMVSISALSIAARPDHPNRHDIRLVLIGWSGAIPIICRNMLPLRRHPTPH